ncbi:MAG TPA: GDP-mannose 4,6-dehydratase [Acidimicrobiales bacterium]|nr:GDP-mannose 4,6-dehydratase [Acidimicrobiales bacterium]
MTRVLVTGADGFVGRHLVAHLGESGDDVRGIDRERDVTNATTMRDVFDDVRPEVTYHLAALTHVGESWEHASEFTRVNVVGTQRVLDASFATVPESTTLLVSSSEVYGIVGEEDQPLHESFRVAPANPYSASKVEAERVAREALRTRNQRVIVARPFSHLGPGQNPTFVVPALVTRLLDARDRGDDEISVGDLSTRRDFSDVRDVVRAYRLLAQLGVTGEIYNVASGHDVAISDIAQQLVDAVAPGVRLVVDPMLLRPIEIPISRGSFEKLNQATGWSPSIPLHVSLSDVIDDLVARRGEMQ